MLFKLIRDAGLGESNSRAPLKNQHFPSSSWRRREAIATPCSLLFAAPPRTMKLSASLLALHLFDTTAFRSFSIMSKRSVPTPQAQSKRQRSLTGFFAAKSSSASSDDTTSATALSSTTSSSSSPSWRIFCDLDGVLVDFNSGVKKLFNGRSPDELPNQGMMWGAISKSDQFYANLPWTEDGKVLWDAIKNHVSSSVLTWLFSLQSSPTCRFTVQHV